VRLFPNEPESKETAMTVLNELLRLNPNGIRWRKDVKDQRLGASIRKLLLSVSLFGLTITGAACVSSAGKDIPKEPGGGEIEQSGDLAITLIVANEKKSYPGGKIVITNKSKHLFRIKFDPDPLVYLDLIVRDSDQNKVSSGNYGAKFSWWGKERELCLEPNEKYEDTINLFATVKKEARKPGKYSIQAVYIYDRIKYISNTANVTLK
jgi:hypothetical protein